MLWTRELLITYRQQAKLPELPTHSLDQVLAILNSIHSDLDGEDNLSFIEPTTRMVFPDLDEHDPRYLGRSTARRCK